MDRNERSRRHKQNIDARTERRSGQKRSGGRPDQGYSQARPQQQVPPRVDRAPLYDQDQGRTPAPQPPKGKKQHVHVTKKDLRRRARRRRMLAVFFVLAAVIVGAVLSVTLLFNVTSITVRNPEAYTARLQAQVTLQPPADSEAVPSEPPADSAASSVVTEEAAAPQPTAAPQPEVTVDTGPYTQLQITSALGVQLGDNLFSFKIEEKERLMALALPLLEEIDLQRKYPGTLVVQVTPAEATWCTPVDSGWLVLSRSLKVMELVTEQPQTLRLLLCDARSGQPGTALATLSYDRLLAEYQAAVAAAELAAADPNAPQATMPPDEPIQDENRMALDELLTALDEAGLLDSVTAIDTTDPEETAFVYQDRICVLLGTTNQLDYKLDWAATILLNVDGKGCSATDVGVLDISHIRTDGTIQPVFRQGSYELPSRQNQTPDAEEDPTPSPDPQA